MCQYLKRIRQSSGVLNSGFVVDQSQDIYTSLMCTWEMKFGLGESVVLSLPVPRS